MEDKIYYESLQIMVDKAKELKTRIDANDDYEAKGYLQMALELLYVDIRELIKQKELSK
jgi:hypothetical protein